MRADQKEVFGNHSFFVPYEKEDIFYAGVDLALYIHSTLRISPAILNVGCESRRKGIKLGEIHDTNDIKNFVKIVNQEEPLTYFQYFSHLVEIMYDASEMDSVKFSCSWRLDEKEHPQEKLEEFLNNTN